MPQREATAAKLRKRQADRPSTAARHDKHLMYLNGQIAEVATCSHRIAAIKAAIDALPAAPAAEHTASKLLGLLTDLKALYKEAFDLSQPSASKALATAARAVVARATAARAVVARARRRRRTRGRGGRSRRRSGSGAPQRLRRQRATAPRRTGPLRTWSWYMERWRMRSRSPSRLAWRRH